MALEEVLEAIEKGDYKRSRRPVAKAEFVPSELDPLLWAEDERRISIGLWLRELREAMRMSPSELAAAARMDYHTIEGLEAGESKSYLTTKRLRVLVATLRVRQAGMKEALKAVRRAGKVDGALLRSTREAFGLGQHDVGVWAGFTGTRKGVMISAYELGQYAIPDSLATAFLSRCDALMRAVDDAAGWQRLSGELGLE